MRRQLHGELGSLAPPRAEAPGIRASHSGIREGGGLAHLMEGTSSNLDVFAATLAQAAKADRDILVVTSDSRGSGRLTPFAAAVPEQIVEVGIAEQNLVGISAGLAAAGKKVFAVSPACFLTARALEQIKNDVCYSDRPVKVVGISAGVSYGALGSTHHSLHDSALASPCLQIRTRTHLIDSQWQRPFFFGLW